MVFKTPHAKRYGDKLIDLREVWFDEKISIKDRLEIRKLDKQIVSYLVELNDAEKEGDEKKIKTFKTHVINYLNKKRMLLRKIFKLSEYELEKIGVLFHPIK